MNPKVSHTLQIDRPPTDARVNLATTCHHPDDMKEKYNFYAPEVLGEVPFPYKPSEIPRLHPGMVG